MNVSVLRLNRGLLNPISHFAMLVCHKENPQPAYKHIVGETQNVNAATPLSKPEDYHRVNTFFISLDNILAEIENPFRGNEREFFFCV